MFELQGFEAVTARLNRKIGKVVAAERVERPSARSHPWPPPPPVLPGGGIAANGEHHSVYYVVAALSPVPNAET